MKPYWICQCDCGTVKEICGDNLRAGATNSCGCQVRRSTIERSTKHGYSRRGKNKSRIYKIWAKMKGRCECESDQAYKHYGGRGISVCDEWHDFLKFKDWSYANGYTDELTIDRIDVNGNYEPSNCRWVDWNIQANNTRKTVKVTLGDVTHSVKEWCDELNLNCGTVLTRYRRGMNIYDAMFTPAKFTIPIVATDDAEILGTQTSGNYTCVVVDSSGNAKWYGYTYRPDDNGDPIGEFGEIPYPVTIATQGEYDPSSAEDFSLTCTNWCGYYIFKANKKAGQWNIIDISDTGK